MCAGVSAFRSREIPELDPFTTPGPLVRGEGRGDGPVLVAGVLPTALELLPEFTGAAKKKDKILSTSV